jgi:hypothetical protein
VSILVCEECRRYIGWDFFLPIIRYVRPCEKCEDARYKKISLHSGKGEWRNTRRLAERSKQMNGNSPNSPNNNK